MFKKEITFDRFVRGLLLLAVLVIAFFLLKYLSPVLIPFFVAWIIAYMLYPLVAFLQYKCRLKNRILCIFLSWIILAGVVTALAYIVVPPFVDECGHIKEVAGRYFDTSLKHKDSAPAIVKNFINEKLSTLQVDKLLKQKDIQSAIKSIVPKAWDFVSSTAGTIVNILASLISILYLFFLLKDYERYADGWIRFVPHKNRNIASQIMSDIKHGMNGYFRGQLLVALSNCVMFSVGFLLIDFPMPIGLGCFIGIISFVPYLQVVGFIPALVLALLRSADTGQNFFLLMGLVLLVYIVVQVLQDTIVTPHVMGKIMGLSPAVILLSLSVWGYMLGIIGLIIALPVTTLMISYYHRYIIGAPPEPSPTERLIRDTTPVATEPAQTDAPQSSVENNEARRFYQDEDGEP